jgi:uncharacterized protein YdeI (YjbR/CyaY-like superfamily)
MNGNSSQSADVCSTTRDISVVLVFSFFSLVLFPTAASSRDWAMQNKHKTEKKKTEAPTSLPEVVTS